MNHSKGALGHVLCVPLVVLFGQLYDAWQKLMLSCFRLHFSHSLVPVCCHDLIVFQLPVVFDLVLNLLAGQALVVVVALNTFLLCLEDLFTCRDMFGRSPVALLYLDVLPFCRHACCHLIDLICF